MVLAFRNIKEERFLKHIQSDPSQRDPNLWCEFHGTHGHRSKDCQHLREEVAVLLKNGHLREFLSDRAKINYGKNQDTGETAKLAVGSPHLTINMIFGGDEVNGVIFLAAKKTKISKTHGKRIREASEDDDITFIDDDANGLLLPHNNAMMHEMKVAPSAYHQLLKFPTPEVFKQIRGDQPAAREMNAVTLSSSKGKETSK
uniref:Uncharacterized protein n=1 Tax=Nicotiana tabacum TaxID=4097 RepID=A0A1S4BJQ8_TOBAC|nr:PREDICTED: uncharacterized protein LOC107809076 [Nicotiana tabacum]